MKEILASNIDNALKVLGIFGINTYNGERYQVWELSDEEFEKLCNIPDKDWLEDYGMWRSANGSVLMGDPLDTFIVNNRNMLGFVGSFREEDAKENETLPEEDQMPPREMSYFDLFDYMCEELGASQPKNIVAVAMDLANINNIRLSGLFGKYQEHEK